LVLLPSRTSILAEQVGEDSGKERQLRVVDHVGLRGDSSTLRFGARASRVRSPQQAGSSGRRACADLVAASSTPLVLSILAQEESYGYAILKRVRALSDGELQWTDGMLYPLLHRLSRLGYVTTEWRTPPEGRRRRYYILTDAGRAALADQRRQWETVIRALDDVWRGPGDLLAVGET
jgi:DNA-binding PadR family transcriptional regulator